MTRLLKKIHIDSDADGVTRPCTPVNLDQYSLKEQLYYLTQQIFLLRCCELVGRLHETKLGVLYRQWLTDRIASIESAVTSVTVPGGPEIVHAAKTWLTNTVLSGVPRYVCVEVFGTPDVHGMMIPKSYWDLFYSHDALRAALIGTDTLNQFKDPGPVKLGVPFLCDGILWINTCNESFFTLPETDEEKELIRQGTVFGLLFASGRISTIMEEESPGNSVMYLLGGLTVTRETPSLYTFLNQACSKKTQDFDDSFISTHYHIGKRDFAALITFLEILEARHNIRYVNAAWFSRILKLSKEFDDSRAVVEKAAESQELDEQDRSILEKDGLGFLTHLLVSNTKEDASEQIRATEADESATEGGVDDDESSDDDDVSTDEPDEEPEEEPTEDDPDTGDEPDKGDDEEGGDEESEEGEEEDDTEDDTDTHTQLVIGGITITRSDGEPFERKVFDTELLRAFYNSLLSNPDELSPTEINLLISLRDRWLYLVSVESQLALLKMVFAGKKMKTLQLENIK